jgi:hypothetical protein
VTETREINRSGKTPRLVKPPKASKEKPCPRIPVCLLEQLRDGVAVYLQRHGDTWGIFGRIAGKPIARRKHKKDAELLVDAARIEATKSSAPAAVSAEDLQRRRRCRVVTPQRPGGEAAHYEVIDAGDLITSHDPGSFQPDPRYPVGVQEREYHRSEDEKRKVIVGAQNLDPSFLLTDTPSAIDGPPLVTSGSPVLALGGNGRGMMIRRAYREGAAGGDRYRSELTARAADFGFSADDVQRFTRPVLVRAIDGLSARSTASELSQAVRRYNEALTQQLSPRARAVAEARQLRPSTVAGIGELLASAGDSSLRDVMRDQPAELLALLRTDGVVNDQNRGQWTAGAGLTDEGKDRLEGMFLGLVVGSGDRLSATPPATLKKIERAVPHLIRVAGLNPPLDLIPAVQQAIDLGNDAAARGMTIEQLDSQGTLLAGIKIDASEDARSIARLFAGAGAREVGERFKAWARLAAVDPHQPSMFWTPPTYAGALAELLGRSRKINPAGSCCPVVRSPATSTEQLARALLEQLDRAPDRLVVIDRGAESPITLQFSSGVPSHFWLNGRNRAALCRALTKDLRRHVKRRRGKPDDR